LHPEAPRSAVGSSAEKRSRVQCLVPERGARRNKALDEVSAAIPGDAKRRQERAGHQPADVNKCNTKNRKLIKYRAFFCEPHVPAGLVNWLDDFHALELVGFTKGAFDININFIKFVF
jgi:hypothetical protein